MARVAIFVVVLGPLAMLLSDAVYRVEAAERTWSRVAWTRVPCQPMGCDQGPANPPSWAADNLDEEAADWGIYCEGAPTWAKQNVTTPSRDGKSLRCAITGGEPYSNLHCYRNLSPEPTTSVFTLTLSFWFSPTTTLNNQDAPSVIQALEFTMNKWHESQRHEFALQWQDVGDGAPQWRYWDPNQPEPWIGLGLSDTLEGERWHDLSLEGEIIHGQVTYRRFVIDGQRHDLDLSVPPVYVPGEADRLAVAIQLDGNFKETPYDLFIDQVRFVRKPAAQVYLPLAYRIYQKAAAKAIEPR